MGFNLLKQKYLKNIDSTVFLYEHEKTKARLLYFKNEDVNKSFSISFKTIPYNNNGIFHILEHSVLCGSEKYPVKEPFVELIKGSFNTFINAMTFPDKTMYPVSSKNNEDLEILTDIYLDAVFNPQLLKNNLILQQEGWHYHLENLNDDLIYKGVVYNEMKGVYSSVDEILDMHITESIFPNSPYKYSSGGKPEDITSISQEEFIETYKYCYHPSNSFITLYGNLNLDSYLQKIDNYLEKYDFKDYNSYQVPIQRTIAENDIRVQYYNDNTEDKHYVAINYILGKNKDFESIYSIDVIDELLLGSSNTPFRKFFIDNGYAEDVYSYIQRDRLEVVYSIIFKNVKETEVDKIENLFVEVLSNELENNFDYEQVEAIINKNSFIIKEEVNKVSSPKGVNYAVRALRNWLYDECPFDIFDYDNIINILKSNYKKRLYEKIARELILNNNKKTVVKLLASKENEKNDSLVEYQNTLSEKELKKIVENTKNLINWQESEDSKDDLEKIPSIDSKKVIIKKPYKDTYFENIDSTKFAHYNEQTNGIIYSKLLFDISYFNKEELEYAALLTFLLFNINTKNKSELEITKDIDFNLGGINSSVNIFKNDKNDNVNIKFIVSAKHLTEKSNKLVDILKENTLNYDFNNKQAIFNIILELKLSLESRFKNAGHSFINKRLESYYSFQAKLAEYISGYDFYLFIDNIVDNFEDNFENISNKLYVIASTIFKKDNLIISCVSLEKDYNEFKKHILNYVNFLDENNASLVSCSIPFKVKPSNYAEGFYFDTLVQYVGLGFNINKYCGSLLVLRHILNYDYLWNNVRVKNGAYGVGLTINKFGSTGFWSYRDPNLAKTLSTYLDVAKYVENLDIDDVTMNKYIIGALNAFDQLLSPNEKATISLNNHLVESDSNNFDKLVNEIKNTTLSDLKKLAPLFAKFEDNNYKCIIGSKNIIDENKDIFTKIIEIK